VAAATSHIRVGSGGVMLPHYSPLKVAETFSMLNALYDGRIDLGLGRAPGTSPAVAHALRRDRRQPPLDDFREQLEELLAYLDNRSPAANPLARRAKVQFCSPEVALLGSSPQSAIWAAECGLPYVFADFISPGGAEFARHYRESFRPSARWAAPHVAVATWTICADSDEEAERLGLSLRMMMTMLFRGQQMPVPTVERAEAFVREEGVPAESLPAGRRIIAGNPVKVRAALESVVGEYGADELFLINILHDHAARRRSYELAARAFALTPRAA
jgi:luciferase family oxidoreductase group 1